MLRLVGTALLLAAMLVAQGAAQVAGKDGKAAASRITMEQVWAMDAIYRDTQHGVSFRYPSVWKPGTQFGYHPPALTQADQAKQVKGFFYQEGGFPRDELVGPYAETNLEGFGLVYLSVPAASGAACEAKATSLTDTNKHETVQFGGRQYSGYETSGAAMSQSIYGELYATYANHTCYLFEWGVAEASAAVVEVRDLTPAESRSIEHHLLEIMRSIRIIPSKP